MDAASKPERSRRKKRLVSNEADAFIYHSLLQHAKPYVPLCLIARWSGTFTALDDTRWARLSTVSWVCNDRSNTLRTSRTACNRTSAPFRPIGQYTVNGKLLERVRRRGVLGSSLRQPCLRARIHAIICCEEIVPVASAASIIERDTCTFGGVVRVTLIATTTGTRFRWL